MQAAGLAPRSACFVRANSRWAPTNGRVYRGYLAGRSRLSHGLNPFHSKLFAPSSPRLLSASSALASDGAVPEAKRTELPAKADVVVIGGGALGTSVLYHLAKEGFRDIVLLEKSELTAGSTWHAAGLVTYYHGGANARLVHHYSLQLYPEVEKETGQEMSFHKVGSIRMMESKERMDECMHQMGRSKLWPAKQELITPHEAKKLHPLLNVDGLYGCIYNPGDGHIDPSSVANGLAAGAKARGAKILKPVEVTGLHHRPDSKWDVRTDKGSVTADLIVNCGGLWGDKVGEMAGVHTPVVPIKHQYVIIGPIQEVIDYQTEHGHQLPVVRDLRGSYYARQERDGLLVGPYESREAMQICDDWAKGGIPRTWGMDLFEGDMDRIMSHVEVSMQRIPCIANGNIRSVINGPVSWPADGNPLLGPVVGKKGYWSACGASYGIAHAGGIGKYLVDWIKDGEPPYELFEFDVTRYGRWATKRFVMEKVKETYGRNNWIVYPYEERPVARPVRTSPLYQRLKERGGEFGFHNGWETPNWFAKDADETQRYRPSFRRTNWFEPVGREVKNVCENAGVIDLSAFSKYYVRGAHASAFMERVCANAMPKAGKVNISHMLTPKGKMYAELTVARLAENEYYVVTGSNMELHDLRWLAQHVGEGEDVRIENATSRMGVLGVVGPKAREVLSRLTLSDVSQEAFKFLDCKHMEVANAPVLAVRVSYTGELGWELHHDACYTPALYEALLDAGREHGIDDFGSYAMNSLRLEKGFRLLGMDMTKDHNALEAGLEGRFVKLDKAADFIGKAALLKIKSEGGAAKKSVCVTVDTAKVDADCVGNEPIYAHGDDHRAKVAGFTTSGGFGYNVNKSIALGYVDAALAGPGTRLKVWLLGEMCDAEVAHEPLVETESVRSRKKQPKHATGS